MDDRQHRATPNPLPAVKPVVDIEAAEEIWQEIWQDDGKDRQFVVALARGLEVLRAFAPNETLLGNQEIAARTGLPKPTVSRLTHTLCKLGYLRYVEGFGKYQLGIGTLALGCSALASIGVRGVARPLMQALADHTNVSVSLGSRDRLDMVYVESCRSDSTVTLRLDVGAHIPIATTAMGRALLAGMPAAERAYLMGHLVKHYGEAWPQVEAGIRQAVADYRTLGFTISTGDWQREVHAVGVPLNAPDGSGLLALNCGGPSFMLDRDRLVGDIGPRLVALARNIEAAALGR